MALGFLLFAAVWLALLDAGSLTAPTDNIEQLTWVRSLQWGYYKHPPLPTWMLWPLVKLIGLRPMASYLMGAAVTLAALGAFAHLLWRLRGPAFACTAVLATLCVTFYNGRLYYYNHNTVLLLFAVGSAWATWLALHQRRLRWWAVLGLMLGLGGLSKYQIAVTGVSVAALWLQQRAWRDAVHRRGAVLAAAVALLVMAPHLVWLVRNDFPPMHYAMATSLGVDLPGSARLAAVSHWLVDLLLNRALPAWLVLGFALAPALRGGQDQPAPGAADDATGLARALLLAFGLVPLTMMPAMGLLGGVDLQLQWGTAFAVFVVAAGLELLTLRSGALVASAPLRALQAFLAVQALLLAINWATSPLGPARWQSAHWCRFKSAGLAEAVGEAAREAAGRPIRIVEGPAAMAGALALQLPERPLVLIDGNPGISPWISSEALRLCQRLQLDTVPMGPHDRSWTPAGPRFPDIQWRVVEPGDIDKPCPI